jgi:aminopeptidase N
LTSDTQRDIIARTEFGKFANLEADFYFVTRTHSSSSKQAWTQGETLEAKYWFPCLEDPQVKFPREIKVIVSENNLIVLSNGELAQKDGNTWTWTWTEPNPTLISYICCYW